MFFRKKQNILVVGAGYVGLVVSSCLAKMGHRVICVDNNSQKIDMIKKGVLPFFEPHLERLLLKNIKRKRLIFSEDIDFAVKNSDVCFIAVGTYPNKDYSVNLDDVFAVSEKIAKSMNGYKVIVIKSTAPVGTNEKVKEIISKNTKFDFDVVSNPEFLKQGSAVRDVLKPDRIIIGSKSPRAIKIMEDLYGFRAKLKRKIIVMDEKSAEMTKYAANSFLAAKISFINEIARLCEKTGADIENVRLGLISDKRIGNKFLFPGLGYGGSCFPKDVKALIKQGAQYDCEMSIIKAVDKVNESQKLNFLDKILTRFNNNIKGLTFGVWGLAYKKQTDDMRYAPSIKIINELLKRGAKIKAFDFKAIDKAKEIFKNKIEFCETPTGVLIGADALLVLTEWDEFSKFKPDEIKKWLKTPLIFDGRNKLNQKDIVQADIEYISIGR